MSNEPRHERSGYAEGIGRIRLNVACEPCGRPVVPSDFQYLGDGVLRAVCGGCHRDMLHVGLDLDDLVETDEVHLDDVHFEPNAA